MDIIPCFDMPNLKQIAATIPLGLFIVIGLVLAYQLYHSDPLVLPSALQGKTAPRLALAPLIDADLSAVKPGIIPPGIILDDLLNPGGVTLVNFWASWCLACREESPMLLGLAKLKYLKIVGVNYKDQPQNAVQFLQDFGNPYHAIGVDARGSTAIDWGVYGIPETFIIDGQGIIRLRLPGAITKENLKTIIMPIVAKIMGEQSSSP